MSILQDKLSEIRYLKRKNLHEESKIIGNYYRDIIHQYGVDCNYYKLKTNYPNFFKTSIDQNNLILHAYGYDVNPDYSLSAKMITYMEVENDIFNLNKYGIIPNSDVNFYFDATEFACNLAVCLGKYKEFKIKEEKYTLYLKESELETLELVLPFESEIIFGKIVIPFENLSLELNAKKTVNCEAICTSKPRWTFPVNEDIVKSFEYTVKSENAEAIMILADLIMREKREYEKIDCDYVMSIKLHGTVLFHDVNAIDKYKQHIVPNAGDVITIDFPDENNRERYEITECIDKQLTPDGINPLLHKYVWKCKARRYVNGQENFPEKNDADLHVAEKQDLINTSDSLVGKAIELYNDDEDEAYGGYDKKVPYHDIDDVKGVHRKLWKKVDKTVLIEILGFGNGSKLVTNGYDLYFAPNNQDEVLLVNLTTDRTWIDKSIYPMGELKFLKANDQELTFVNVDGEMFKLTVEKDIPPEIVKLCLDSLMDLSVYDNGMENVNSSGENYYKFSNCNTILISIGEHLYCRFGNKKILRIV